MDNEKLDRLGMLLLDMIDEHDELCAMQEQLARHGSLSADAACVLRRIPIYHDLGLVPAAEGMAYHSVQLKEYTRKLRTARESFLETITDGIKKFWNAILNFFRRLFGGEEKMIEDTTAHLKKELEKKERVKKKTPPPAKEERASEEEAKKEKEVVTFKGLPEDVRRKVEDFLRTYNSVDIFIKSLDVMWGLEKCETKKDCNSTMLEVVKHLNAAVSGSDISFKVDERMMIQATGYFGVKREELELKDVPNPTDSAVVMKGMDLMATFGRHVETSKTILNDLNRLRISQENSLKGTEEEIIKLRHRCIISTVNAIRRCVISTHQMKRTLVRHYKNMKLIL